MRKGLKVRVRAESLLLLIAVPVSATLTLTFRYLFNRYGSAMRRDSTWRPASLRLVRSSFRARRPREVGEKLNIKPSTVRATMQRVYKSVALPIAMLC